MLTNILSFLHSRLFNFVIFPIAIVCLYLGLVQWGDLATRSLILLQFIPLVALAYVISKALLGKTDLRTVLDSAMEENLSASFVYVAIVFARVCIFFTLALAYVIALHSSAG